MRSPRSKHHYIFKNKMCSLNKAERSLPRVAKSRYLKHFWTCLFHLIWPFRNNIINIYLYKYIYIYIYIKLYIYIHYINIWQHCIAGTLIDTYQKIPGTDYYWQDTTFGKVNTHTQKKSWYLSEMLSTLSKALAFNFSTQICRTRIGYSMKLNKQILATEKSMLFHSV